MKNGELLLNNEEFYLGMEDILRITLYFARRKNGIPAILDFHH